MRETNMAVAVLVITQNIVIAQNTVGLVNFIPSHRSRQTTGGAEKSVRMLLRFFFSLSTNGNFRAKRGVLHVA